MPGCYVYVGCDCVIKWFDRTQRNKVIVGVTFATDGKCRYNRSCDVEASVDYRCELLCGEGWG